MLCRSALCGISRAVKKKTKSSKEEQSQYQEAIEKVDSTPILKFFTDRLKTKLNDGDPKSVKKWTQFYCKLWDISPTGLKHRKLKAQGPFTSWMDAFEPLTGVPQKDFIKFLQTYPEWKKSVGRVSELDAELLEEFSRMSQREKKLLFRLIKSKDL